jgi:hypothetical protein
MRFSACFGQVMTLWVAAVVAACGGATFSTASPPADASPSEASSGPGSAAVDTSFTFAAITGPTYDLRYQTTRTVNSGCGSTGFSATGSTVTLQ